MRDEVPHNSPDTFDVLRERTRNLRAKREHVEWSSISLEMRGVPVKRSGRTARHALTNLCFGIYPAVNRHSFEWSPAGTRSSST